MSGAIDSNLANIHLRDSETGIEGITSFGKEKNKEN